MIQDIVQVCLIPILGILVKYLIDYLTAKKDEVIELTDSELVEKYTNLVYDTVVTCVIATNQTYVNSLKNSGSFDIEAQQEAFQKTLDAVLAILSEDVMEYLSEIVGDVTIYLTNLIEQVVNENRAA